MKAKSLMSSLSPELILEDMRSVRLTIRTLSTPQLTAEVIESMVRGVQAVTHGLLPIRSSNRSMRPPTVRL